MRVKHCSEAGNQIDETSRFAASPPGSGTRALAVALQQCGRVISWSARRWRSAVGGRAPQQARVELVMGGGAWWGLIGAGAGRGVQHRAGG